MEGLIVIIGIIISIVNAVNKSAKNVKKNAPGKAAAPARPAAPAAPVPRMEQRAPAAPSVKPSVQPSQPAQTFWQEVGDWLKEELGPEEKQPAKGHEQAAAMAEGDSRECEHGSIGGSMAYGAHQEGKTAPAAKRQSADEPAAVNTLYRPAMNAQEMRRAVVMAEILKRPQERMAEQARRWNAR